MTLTLMQGHSGLAEGENQLWIISITNVMFLLLLQVLVLDLYLVTKLEWDTVTFYYNKAIKEIRFLTKKIIVSKC